MTYGLLYTPMSDSKETNPTENEPADSQTAPPTVESRRPSAAKREITVSAAASFSGPLPPPGVLRSYNEIVPGAADRIITMAESQQSHRQRLERAVIEENCKSQSRGLNFGFVISMTVIIGGFFLIHEGKDTTGIIAVIGALGSLVGLFILGKRKQSKELAAKNRAFQAENDSKNKSNNDPE